MNPLTIALAILAAGLAVLIFNHDGGRTLGLANDDFGNLIMLGAIATMIGAGVVGSRRQLGTAVRQLGLWALIALVLVALYLYRGELEGFGARMTAGLVPGRATVVTDSEGRSEVVLHKLQNGHFETDVMVNGMATSMLVDTGASSIALTWDDAERLGLDPANLDFRLPIMTANGQAMAAPVTLDTVAIGPIARNRIRATVAERGRLDQSLLGMTFLSTLGFLQMQADELRLRD